MQIRNANKAGEKIELQMTPMIDIVFQLLVFFIMTFKRKIAYHVISVYLPSSTTFVISLITMYVHNKHIEAIIVVHLTAMLVMTTLFQAISVSLPQVGR